MRTSYVLLKIFTVFFGLFALALYVVVIFWLSFILEIITQVDGLIIGLGILQIIILGIAYLIALFKEKVGATIILIFIIPEFLALTYLTEFKSIVTLILINVPLLITSILFFICSRLKKKKVNEIEIRKDDSFN